MNVEDIVRLDLGFFVRPSEETGTGRFRAEPALGYVVKHPAGAIVFDTGIGQADEETEQHYQPVRRSLRAALSGIGLDLDDVRFVVNCHLHFDHCGGNPAFSRTPIVVQETELANAHTVGYTFPTLIDFPEARYETIAGEIELIPDVFIVPTPSHTSGHQSLVVRCVDGTVVCAGQSHDFAHDYGSDLLMLDASRNAKDDGPPAASEWFTRIQSFDPRRILFAHDLAYIDV